MKTLHHKRVSSVYVLKLYVIDMVKKRNTHHFFCNLTTFLSQFISTLRFAIRNKNTTFIATAQQKQNKKCIHYASV